MAEFWSRNSSLNSDIRLYKNVDRPNYSKPTQIGTFSLDKNGEFLDDTSSLKYYYKKAEEDVKRRGYDMNIGFEQYLETQNESESYRLSLDNLLKWMKGHKEEIRGDEANQLWPKFVCWRGLLTRLLTTMCIQRDDWIIAVTLHQGTYYLCEYETEKRHQDRLNPPPQQARMAYWGHKFEQFCVSDSPGGRPEEPEVPIAVKEQYCSVVTSKLDQHRLLFGGEVDCCDPADTTRYIELKTNRIFTHPKQELNFGRLKAVKWWAQSFLIGVQEIVAGFRDDDGIVRSLKSYQPQRLPSLSAGAWDPATAFTFAHRLLNFIKDTVKIDDPRHVCLLRHDAEDEIVTTQMYPGPSEWSFLPDWYIEK